MLTREQLIKIQNQLELAYADAARANRSHSELVEILESIRLVIAARREL